jgi:hypothetical protein
MWRSYEFISSVLKEKTCIFYRLNRVQISSIVLDYIKERKDGFYGVRGK